MKGMRKGYVKTAYGKRVLETEPPWGLKLRVRWAMCERIRLGA